MRPKHGRLQAGAVAMPKRAEDGHTPQNGLCAAGLTSHNRDEQSRPREAEHRGTTTESVQREGGTDGGRGQHRGQRPQPRLTPHAKALALLPGGGSKTRQASLPCMGLPRAPLFMACRTARSAATATATSSAEFHAAHPAVRLFPFRSRQEASCTDDALEELGIGPLTGCEPAHRPASRNSSLGPDTRRSPLACPTECPSATRSRPCVSSRYVGAGDPPGSSLSTVSPNSAVSLW